MAYTPGQLSDLEAIREAARRYCRGVDRMDAELMKSAYWPEATDDHGVFKGNAWAFVDICVPAHERFRATMHCIFNHSVALDDDGRHARGEVYKVSYVFPRDSGTLETWWGRYLDRYEKRGAEWRILERVCVHEGDAVQPLGAGMAIDASGFRQGDADRPGRGRPIGP